MQYKCTPLGIPVSHFYVSYVGNKNEKLCKIGNLSQLVVTINSINTTLLLMVFELWYALKFCTGEILFACFLLHVEKCLSSISILLDVGCRSNYLMLDALMRCQNYTKMQYEELCIPLSDQVSSTRAKMWLKFDGIESRWWWGWWKTHKTNIRLMLRITGYFYNSAD